MKDSLKEHLHVIHGMGVSILGDDVLSTLVSDYFQTFYHGETLLDAPTLKFEFHMTNTPPPIPFDSVKAIEGPHVTYYRNNEKVYTVLDDGSYICLDPLTQKAKGFLKSNIINNAIELYGLIGSSVLEALKYYGLYPVHAAALQGNGIRCLVSGDGGCGKTTTTLGLVREGFQFVSDDSLFLREARDGIIASPLYTHVNVDQNLADRFPEILESRDIIIPERVKKSIDVTKPYPHEYIPSLRPDVIIFPEIVSSQKSSLEPINEMATYSLLLEQTILPVDNDTSRKQLKIIELLVKQSRGFKLLSGKDIYDDPRNLVYLMSEKINGHGYC
jgi:hypothetical protein